jgi:signal transduction histidine kinase
VTIASLYPYFILIGLSIILATSLLLIQARARVEITNELVQLNQSLSFDLPNFLRHCWRPLKKAGFRGISWQLDWFGSALSFEEGSTAEMVVERVLEVQDIKLTIKLYDGKRRFEQRYFSTVISESFFLLLYTDMWVKLGTVQGAFAQTAKMSVFLQHDMKNIVQLVSLMTEQLESAPEGSEVKIITGLKTVMPTLRDRSERFLSSLSSQRDTKVTDTVDLNQALKKTAEIHELSLTVEGKGMPQIGQRAMDSIFDNIFGNYVDQNRRDPDAPANISINIKECDEHLTIEITDTFGKPCLWPERLFEPFWSEKGDGLGIGLYHARQLVKEAGGTITAITPQDAPLKFVVVLPR